MYITSYKGLVYYGKYKDINVQGTSFMEVIQKLTILSYKK